MALAIASVMKFSEAAIALLQVIASGTDSYGHFNITSSAHNLLVVFYSACGPKEGCPL
jgi:hypothetical protein